MKYYIVGIKGTGCSSLACYLKDMGYDVLGSDVNDEFFTDKILKDKKIEVLLYNENNIKNEFIYIIGNGATNSVEAKIIKNKGYEYYSYSDFINKISIPQKIAISGTHGKTTTTSMLFHLLKDISPSLIKGDGVGIGNKNSKTLIFEACEYKDNFLSYFPIILLINNIELDHPDYFKSKKQLTNSFQNFANQSKYLVINGDNKLCRKIKHSNITRFGFKKNNDYQCKIIDKSTNGYLIKINNELISFPYSGKHMIYNFLACYSIIQQFYKEEVKSYSLSAFSLPNRRLEKWYYKNTVCINDYAHHPTEINALYDAVKQEYPNYKLIVFFQPHTYSRTLKFLKKFKKVLSKFDEVYIENVFNSRESKDDKLQKIIDKKLIKFNKLNIKTFKSIIGKTQDKKVIYLFLGAGNLISYINIVK